MPEIIAHAAAAKWGPLPPSDGELLGSILREVVPDLDEAEAGQVPEIAAGLRIHSHTNAAYESNPLRKTLLAHAVGHFREEITEATGGAAPPEPTTNKLICKGTDLLLDALLLDGTIPTLEKPREIYEQVQDLVFDGRSPLAKLPTEVRDQATSHFEGMQPYARLDTRAIAKMVVSDQLDTTDSSYISEAELVDTLWFVLRWQRNRLEKAAPSLFLNTCLQVARVRAQN